MKVPYSSDLQNDMINAYNKMLEAQNALGQIKKKFETNIKEVLPTVGLGQGAMVRHIHAKANFGNLSQGEVISEVVNASATPGSRKILLGIRLGKKGGLLSDFYANLDVEDVLEIEQKSRTPFKY